MAANRARIFGLALVVLGGGIAPCLAQNPDVYPPRQLAGDQPPQPGDNADCPGKFHYSSDVEDAGPGNITLNNLVLNEDIVPLVFRWEKADRVRGVLYPLPPGEIDQDPHLIAGYAAQPDTDAPIEFTQHRCKRTAAVYVETKPNSDKSIWSIIKSRFLDAQGKLQDLDVEVRTVSEGEKITYIIDRKPLDITVGLTGLPRIMSPDFFEQAKIQSVDAINAYLGEYLKGEDLAWGPPSWKELSVAFFRPLKARQTIRFSVAAKQPTASTELMILLDSRGRLITTGRVSTVLPTE